MIESNYMSEIIGVCVGKIFVVKNMPSGKKIIKKSYWMNNQISSMMHQKLVLP